MFWGVLKSKEFLLRVYRLYYLSVTVTVIGDLSSTDDVISNDMIVYFLTPSYPITDPSVECIVLV